MAGFLRQLGSLQSQRERDGQLSKNVAAARFLNKSKVRVGIIGQKYRMVDHDEILRSGVTVILQNLFSRDTLA